MSNIAYLRKKAGLTQRQIALKLGVTESTVRNWEKPTEQPWLQRAAGLCELFDCKAEDLLIDPEN